MGPGVTVLDHLTALMHPHAPRVQKMFGGTAFLINDNLVIGTHKDGLIVRIGPEAMPKALEEPFASQMEMGGRMMAGWILVSADGCADTASLRTWIELALAFNRTLPQHASQSGASKSKRKS